MGAGKKSKVILITTGGTIEKIYDESNGQLINRSTIMESHVLSKLRLPHTEVDVRSLLCKDSLEMEEEDRAFICLSLKRVMLEGHPIIVSHGTDTMDQTLAYCHKNIPNPHVPIVFTGAMRPLGLEDSDARQNIVEALMASKILSSGIYLSFHNQIYLAPHVKKNREKMTFEPGDNPFSGPPGKE